MVRYSIDLFNDALIAELGPLIEQHYEELTLHKETIKLDPDWDRYKKLAENNQAVFIGVRDNFKLVGYSLFFIAPHIHYKENIMANNDVLYLLPEYRKGLTGIRLIKFCEQHLQSLGVDKIIWHIKFAKDFRNILYRMGYIDEDALVGKIIRK